MACLFIAGCSRPSAANQVRIEHEVTPQPAKVGAMTINLRLSDKTGRAVEGASIRIEGDMTHPGMPPTVADAAEVAPGLYRGQLELSMAGDWVVVSHITLQSGETMVDQFDLQGVQQK